MERSNVTHHPDAPRPSTTFFSPTNIIIIVCLLLFGIFYIVVSTRQSHGDTLVEPIIMSYNGVGGTDPLPVLNFEKMQTLL